MKIHLDTDIGGDVDDICSIAFLLRSSNIELVGITTSAEEDGRRAGYARHVLNLAGHPDIPVRAGANVREHNCRYNKLDYPDEIKNWGQKIRPLHNPVEDALDLLKTSIDAGAKIITIGASTNLRLLHDCYPGILQNIDLFLMGGYIHDIPAGYPQWGNSDDWNIQLDVASAKTVFENATPTIIPLNVTTQTYLCRSQIPRLEAGDALAQLLAKQITYFAEDKGFEAVYGKTCANLPDDFINFQHDPLACAVAIGFRDGITLETLNLKITIEDTYLHEQISASGKPINVITGVDGARFADHWLDVVCNPFVAYLP
jgi:purine nucleosidase